MDTHLGGMRMRKSDATQMDILAVHKNRKMDRRGRSMKIALIADVHANLIALEAILEVIREEKPDEIISLGDQVNLGPCPRETLELLKEHGVRCLIGNHERYVLEVLAGKPEYEDANFDLVRFTAKKVTAEDIAFPELIQIGRICFCHALPGNDHFPIYNPSVALPQLRKFSFPETDHIICGHGHNPTHYRFPGLTIDSIGSSGCMDEGAASTAMFTMMITDGEETVLYPRFVPYDSGKVIESYWQSSLVEFSPIMAHLSCLQMITNQSYLVPFTKLARSIAAENGKKAIDASVLMAADACFPWPDGLRTEAYWAKNRPK